MNKLTRLFRKVDCWLRAEHNWFYGVKFGNSIHFPEEGQTAFKFRRCCWCGREEYGDYQMENPNK